MPSNMKFDDYVKINNKLFDPSAFFAVGDTVTRVTKASRSYSEVQRGDSRKISEVDNNSGNAAGHGVYSADGRQYFYVYNQKVRLEGSSQWYNASNFMLSKKGESMLALDVDRPTFVREFKEVTVDGKATREYVGEWMPFDNMNAAKVFTTNEISGSIRKDNAYRKFAIFQERHVSQAKQPEIEFV